MLAGCPIAAAHATSIPEVVGEAAVLFDPLDPADICRALEAVTRDPERAADLVRRGCARAPLFSVAAMAERTLDVFERARREPSATDPSVPGARALTANGRRVVKSLGAA
jgi:glycosyltransferase involved in cell wall biosynthesis